VLTEVAAHDPDRFANGGSSVITEDEESSGIIQAPFLGEDYYLIDVQAHSPWVVDRRCAPKELPALQRC
jgi:hypothetical protein